MELWDACIKGAVQGLTEFLPVSSTAHLILYSTLMEQLGLRATELTPFQEEIFDIVLHVGTLGAVLMYYWKDWVALVKQVPYLFQPATEQNAAARRFVGAGGLVWDGPTLIKGLLIAFFTTSIISLVVIKGSALFFNSAFFHNQGIHDISEYYLATPQWVLVHLVVTGLFLWLGEELGKRALNKQHRKLPSEGYTIEVLPKQGFMVGLFQCFAAIFHGISRSGSTMTAGMLMGFTRTEAAHFTFLLSAPIFLAVGLYAFIKLNGATAAVWASLDWVAMLTGAVSAFVVGYICIAGFIKFISRFSLKGFAIYVWLLSGFMAVTGLIH